MHELINQTKFTTAWFYNFLSNYATKTALIGFNLPADVCNNLNHDFDIILLKKIISFILLTFAKINKSSSFNSSLQRPLSISKNSSASSLFHGKVSIRFVRQLIRFPLWFQSTLLKLTDFKWIIYLLLKKTIILIILNNYSFI